MQNHAESSRNFLKNSVLNAKHAKLEQKSEIGHVRALEEREGPGPGPLRAGRARPGPLKSGKSSGKTHPFLTHSYEKMSFWASRQCFLIVLTCSGIFWPKNDTERI